MKIKEELNALKEEFETMTKKLSELTDKELEQVAGGKITFNDKEDVSGATGGSGSSLVIEGGGKSDGPGEMHFPSDEKGLEEPIDPAKRLGF